MDRSEDHPIALLRQRVLRTAAACLLAGAACLPVSGPASAQEEAAVALSPLGIFALGATPGEGFMDALLPYSPYVFDVVVSFARSFVAVTYDERGFDPVTRHFFVSGLDVGRNGIGVSVERIRVNAATSLYEGIAIDTRNMSMDPAMRQALKDLDAEVIHGDIATMIAADIASATYDIDVTADFENIGALAIAAKVEGFHVLLPLEEYEPPPPTDGTSPAEALPPGDVPSVAGKLHSARIAYDDAGLTPAGFAFAAEAQNMAIEELRGMMAIMLTPLISSLFEGLPGGAGPELRQRAAGWSATLQAYLDEPGHLEISFSPEEPFDLAQLKPGVSLTEPMILALDPEVSNEPSERTALLDPATNTIVGYDDMTLAERLVEGLGVPQDVGRGVALALSDVAAGKLEAADIAVRGIVLDPAGAVSDDTAESSYVMLLLAKARGVPVPEKAATAVRARLDAVKISSAETSALTQWRMTEDGKARVAEEEALIGARDWSGLRDVAFGYYEGRSVPRHLGRAYTFAQLAAAGGDRIAATLRNDIAAALADGRLAFDAAASRAETGTIWATIVAGAKEGGTPAPGAQ